MGRGILEVLFDFRSAPWAKNPQSVCGPLRLNYAWEMPNCDRFYIDGGSCYFALKTERIPPVFDKVTNLRLLDCIRFSGLTIVRF